MHGFGHSLCGNAKLYDGSLGDNTADLKYQNRVILHCDLNNFYASVESLFNPRLKTVPCAVCGSYEDRSGIVLAKNDLAKKKGVQTAEVIWKAQQKCPELVIVEPHFDRYERFSKLVYSVYLEYTDLVEAFGLDECWLDVTASQRLFGSGYEIADKIRNEIKERFGLTVSIGVSFNKVFAKLGSDMKKPDAITEITKENFKQKVWGLPASDMLWVGRATKEMLSRFYLKTIGDVATSDRDFLVRRFGKNGNALWRNANGLDFEPVMQVEYKRQIKSVGNSQTLRRDLTNNHEVWYVMLSLSEQVAKRLRDNSLCATGVAISVKTEDLEYREYQIQLNYPINTALTLAQTGFELFERHFKWHKNVRSVGIRGINLVSDDTDVQCSMFRDDRKIEKEEILAQTTDKLRSRFGFDIVKRAVLNEQMNI